MTAANRRSRAVRRVDPDRKDRIIDAAIEVIATHGVAGATHRLIAVQANVPLGSLTYHFTNLEDLREQAFRRHAQHMSQAFAAHFGAVQTTAQLVDEVTDLSTSDAVIVARDWIVAYELYLAALREPALRVITEAWLRASQDVLERMVPPSTARQLGALIEGLALNAMVSTAPVDRGDIHAIVAGALEHVTVGGPVMDAPFRRA